MATEVNTTMKYVNEYDGQSVWVERNSDCVTVTIDETSELSLTEKDLDTLVSVLLVFQQKRDQTLLTAVPDDKTRAFSD